MHTCFQPELQEGISLLAEDEALHVVRVLRMKEGDVLRLVDGQGAEATGTLVAVSKRSASVRVEAIHREKERPAGLILVVAPTKHTDRFEWLLEKATELGVEEIVPVWTERSERRVEKHERWNKVLVAATKQCERRWKPVLHPACPLSQVIKAHAHLADRTGAVAHCMSHIEGAAERIPWTEWQSSQEKAWIAVGPEGDFTVGEVQMLLDQGAVPVHLGNLRLRTETAGMAAVAQFC